MAAGAARGQRRRDGEVNSPLQRGARFRKRALHRRKGGTRNKNGRDACACRPEFVCEVVRPANREHTYLEGLDVRGLQALGALGDFEFNRLAIIQRLVAISHDRGEMDENVLSTLALDESKALAGIEPLHCSLFFTHCIYSFLLTALRSYFEPGRVRGRTLK